MIDWKVAKTKEIKEFIKKRKSFYECRGASDTGATLFALKEVPREVIDSYKASTIISWFDRI